MARYFLDTEFIERGPRFPIELISIGIVAEDGREFYAVSCDYDSDHASDWVKINVLPKLDQGHAFCGHLKDIAAAIVEFIGRDRTPEFWGWYSDYDWVCLCQSYGTMMDLPGHFPRLCRDIKQLCIDRGSPSIPKQNGNDHSAIDDARWNRFAYNFLMSSPCMQWRIVRLKRDDDRSVHEIVCKSESQADLLLEKYSNDGWVKQSRIAPVPPGPWV